MSGIIAVYGLVVSVLIAGGRMYLSHSPCRPTSQRYNSAAYRLLALCRFHPPRGWDGVWIHGACCWLRDWVCGRLSEYQNSTLFRICSSYRPLVRASIRIRVESFCLDGAHPHFWRGPGVVRVCTFLKLSSFAFVNMFNSKPYCRFNHEFESD